MKTQLSKEQKEQFQKIVLDALNTELDWSFKWNDSEGSVKFHHFDMDGNHLHQWMLEEHDLSTSDSDEAWQAVLDKDATYGEELNKQDTMLALGFELEDSSDYWYLDDEYLMPYDKVLPFLRQGKIASVLQAI